MLRYDVEAFNTSTASANKIHDDEIARQFGFRGGLVPGVDVYAYLTHLPVERWGVEWLQAGSLRARFVEPVYDGETVAVSMRDDGGLEVRDPRNSLCATGCATLGATDPVVVEHGGARPRPVPPATPELLAPGTVLAPLELGFHADLAPAYLADVRETARCYRDLSVAHPGWLLRQANYVLTANVALGPWIHVESWVRNHRTVGDGERLEVRAAIRDEWERKGHRFVTLDVSILASGEPAGSVEHTAIWRTRPARDQAGAT
jgi:acyl dehydratase